MQAQVAPSPEPPFVLRSAFDEHMLRAYPNHQPMGEDMVKKVLFAMGATEDTLPRYLAIHNKQWDDIFARAGGKLHTLGVRRSIYCCFVACASTDRLCCLCSRRSHSYMTRAHCILASPTRRSRFASGPAAWRNTGSTASTSSTRAIASP